MGNQLQLLVRRRVLGNNKCSSPVFYVSSTNSASASIIAINGKQLDAETIYIFATCNTPSSDLYWTLKVYTANGTLKGETSGTTYGVGATKTYVGSTYFLYNGNYITIPSGGYIEISGACKKSGFADSDTTTVKIYRTKQKLVVTMTPTGTFPYCKQIFISANYSNCKIRYTYSQNGTPPADPTSSSEEFNWIIIDANTIIKAKAFNIDGGNVAYDDSDVVTTTYYISTPTLSAPVITPATGTYTENQTVEITDTNNLPSPFKIYYTDDGSTPEFTNNNLKTYNGSFIVTETKIIKAIVGVYTTLWPAVHGYSYWLDVKSPVATNVLTLDNSPTLVTEVKGITSFGAILKGTLTYDTDRYADGRITYMVFGFAVDENQSVVESNYSQGGLTRPTITFAVNNPDLTSDRSERSTGNSVQTAVSTRINRVTKEFYFRLTDLHTARIAEGTSLYTRAVAVIYYYKDGKYYADSVAGNTIHFETSYGSETYSIQSGGITGLVHGYNGDIPVTNVKVLIAPINVSFYSEQGPTSVAQSWVKKWGGEIVDISVPYTHNNTTYTHPYSIGYGYIRDPWSYIGDVNVYDYAVLGPTRLSFRRQFANCMMGTLSLQGETYSSQGHNVVRDLFGWGTSGNSGKWPSSSGYSNIPMQNCWYPWATSSDNADYNAYNSATRDLRNVRSDIKQTSPAEPNVTNDSNYQNPIVSADWGSIQSRSSDVMFGKKSGSMGWYSFQQGNQFNNCAWDTSAFLGLTGSTSPFDPIRTRIATLSYDEWYYLLFTRSGSRFAKGRIQCTDFYGHGNTYVNGLFIFNDAWTDSPLHPFDFQGINNASAGFDTNTVTEEIWINRALEHHCIFLPAAGRRYGTQYAGGNTDGYYWTRSYYPSDTTKAYVLHFNASTVELTSTPKYSGCSVRLARYVYS